MAEVSSQLQKPGLRSSCKRCCPAVTDTLVLPTQVAEPLQNVFGVGQGEELLGPHPGWGMSPERLGCKSRVKPSPAFVRACAMKTQGMRPNQALSSALLLQRPGLPSGSLGMGGGSTGHWEAFNHGLRGCFSRVSANVSARPCRRCMVVWGSLGFSIVQLLQLSHV